MDKYSQNEGFNHFAPCFLKNGSSISGIQLQKIKEIFENKNNYENNNNFINCNNISNFSFRDENNNSNTLSTTLPTIKHNYSFDFPNFHGHKLFDDSINNISTIKKDDKSKNYSKLHLGNIMSISFMNNFPKPKYFTPKQTILSKGNSYSNSKILRNINNNSIIQNKGKEEEDKIYNEIKKNKI